MTVTDHRRRRNNLQDQKDLVSPQGEQENIRSLGAWEEVGGVGKLGTFLGHLGTFVGRFWPFRQNGLILVAVRWRHRTRVF